MKTYLFLFLCFSLSLVSCSDKNEPETPTQADRLAAIFGPDDTEEFFYDEYGKISRWTLRTSDSDIQSNYSYPADDLIRTVTMYTYKLAASDSDNRSIYDEMMHLNSDGVVEYTEGEWTSYKGTDPIIRRKYRLDFVYDSENQLTAINYSEWRRDGTAGWEDKPSTWTNTLEWKDGNLEKYTDYLGKSRPDRIVEYSYYGKTAIANSPITAPFIRRDYAPLQRDGVFGKQSAAIYDKITTTWEDGKVSIENYSYTFSTTATSSWIDSYTVTYNGGSEKTFQIKWE